MQKAEFVLKYSHLLLNVSNQFLKNQMSYMKPLSGSLFPIILNGKNYALQCQPKNPTSF